MAEGDHDPLEKFEHGAVLPFRDRKESAKEQGADDRPSNAVTVAVLIGFLVCLVLGGVWLMNTLRDVSRLQDCAMQGRRNCAPIEVPRER